VVKLGLAKTDSAIKPEILDSLATRTGIVTSDYLAAAQAFASAEKPVIVYGKGYHQISHSFESPVGLPV